MWQNTIMMASLALSNLGDPNPDFAPFITENGYESLWETIVRVENLDVRYKTGIISVSRQRWWNRKQSLRLITQKNLKRKSETCEFLIWTPEMRILLNALKRPSSMERRYFEKLSLSFIFTANLVSIKNEVRNGPYIVHSTSLNDKIPGGVVGSGDIFGLRIPNISLPSVLKLQQCY